MTDMTDKWERKDEWHQHGRNFLVTVRHHTVPPARPEYDDEGPHRWCVYAYIYPKHPHFAAFDMDDDMGQDAATCLPLHGGPSLLRRHYYDDGKVSSVQVGADYHHLHDNRFTHYATPDDAREVFRDAQELHDWLQAKDAEVKP